MNMEGLSNSFMFATKRQPAYFTTSSRDFFFEEKFQRLMISTGIMCPFLWLSR